jgi:uncharacterized caspase-like protein
MLRRIASGFAVMAAMVFLFALPASAQQRIALVIGNAAYAKGPVKNSLADGGLVAEALTSVGFEIVEGADLNQTDMRRLVRDFLEKVQAAGPDAIAFVYYSGYGLEFEGDNYLIPVDARLERDSDIPIDAVRLFDILRPLADTPAAAKVVLLDATRPLPFRIEGGRLARGLGAIESAPGLIVGFSSAPGTAAPDGDGPYGAYATAIAEMVREPGLDLDTLLTRVRVRTVEATNGAQVPWNVSQDIKPQVMLVAGAPASPPRLTRTQRPMRDIGPEQAYAMAIEDDTLDGYSEFVRAYPRSPYTARVWAIIRERREALAWRRALLINTPEAYWTYLSRYPGGMYAFDAERRLRRLSAGLRPPSGFRAMMFDDVPPPLEGEPTRLIDIYPDAPPPPRILRAPPAFIVGLPPPSRPGPGQGLWRRPDNPFPVIVNRPPSGPGGFPKKGPTIVNQPPTGAPPSGFQGPPPNWAKPGTGIPKTDPGGSQQQFQKKGPIAVNPPPTGQPPTGQGNQQQFQKKGPAGGPPPGFQGPPAGWAKPGTGIPSTNQQQQPLVKQGNPPTKQGGPPTQQPLVKQGGPPTQQPLVKQGSPPTGMKQVIPPSPPAPPQVKQVTPPPGPQPGFAGPPAGWAKPGTGIPAQGAGPQGQKKCVIVNGQPVCK